MKFGWIQDSQDLRDYAFERKSRAALPTSFDLEKYVRLPVYDQIGQSCVANWLKRMIDMRAVIRGDFIAPVSASFLYYNGRAALGQQGLDEGSVPRVVLKEAKRLGTPAEFNWRENMPASKKPGLRAYINAYKMRDLNYYRLRTVDDLKSALFEKNPCGIGLEVTQSFVDANKDFIALKPVASARIGRHMISLIGYGPQGARALNSWGPNWGGNGRCWIEWEYIEEGLAGDCYAIN